MISFALPAGMSRMMGMISRIERPVGIIRISTDVSARSG